MFKIKTALSFATKKKPTKTWGVRELVADAKLILSNGNTFFARDDMFLQGYSYTNMRGNYSYEETLLA